MQEKVRIDVLRRFGYFSTESNGHLSGYLPWYCKRPRETKQWISLDQWITGETGGYLRVCIEGRNWFTTDFPQLAQGRSPPRSPPINAPKKTATTSSKRWKPAANTPGISTS